MFILLLTAGGAGHFLMDVLASSRTCPSTFFASAKKSWWISLYFDEKVCVPGHSSKGAVQSDRLKEGRDSAVPGPGPSGSVDAPREQAAHAPLMLSEYSEPN